MEIISYITHGSLIMVEFRFTTGMNDRQVRRVKNGEAGLQVAIKKGEGAEYSLSLKNPTGEDYFITVGERLIANQIACISPDARIVAPGGCAEIRVSAAPLFCQGYPATDSIQTSVLESIDTRVGQLVTGNRSGEFTEITGEKERKEAAKPGEYAAASEANGIAAFSTEGLMFAEVFANSQLYASYFDDLIQTLSKHAESYPLKPLQMSRRYYLDMLEEVCSLVNNQAALFPDQPRTVQIREAGYRGQALMDHEGMIHLVLCSSQIPSARFLLHGGRVTKFIAKGEKLRVAYDRDILTLRVHEEGKASYQIDDGLWRMLFGSFALSYESMSGWMSRETCSSIANDMLIALAERDVKVEVEEGLVYSLLPLTKLKAGSTDAKKQGRAGKSSSLRKVNTP